MRLNHCSRPREVKLFNISTKKQILEKNPRRLWQICVSRPLAFILWTFGGITAEVLLIQIAAAGCSWVSTLHVMSQFSKARDFPSFWRSANTSWNPPIVIIHERALTVWWRITKLNRTFFADAGAVDVRTGDVVMAGARGGAVGPVQACRTADRAVVTLDTMDGQREGETERRPVDFASVKCPAQCDKKSVSASKLQYRSGYTGHINIQIQWHWWINMVLL